MKRLTFPLSILCMIHVVHPYLSLFSSLLLRRPIRILRLGPGRWSVWVCYHKIAWDLCASFERKIKQRKYFCLSPHPTWYLHSFPFSPCFNWYSSSVVTIIVVVSIIIIVIIETNCFLWRCTSPVEVIHHTSASYLNMRNESDTEKAKSLLPKMTTTDIRLTPGRLSYQNVKVFDDSFHILITCERTVTVFGWKKRFDSVQVEIL